MEDKENKSFTIPFNYIFITFSILFVIISTFIIWLIFPYSGILQSILSFVGVDSQKEVFRYFIGGLILGIPGLIFWIYFHSPTNDGVNVTVVKDKNDKR